MSMLDDIVNGISGELQDVVVAPNAFRSMIILLFSIAVSYWLSDFVARFVVRIARMISFHADQTTDQSRANQLRRLETHLSVAIAVIRAVIVGVVAFYVWQMISPTASLSTAAIGASAFFIVIASGTVGSILRDVTAGATMIIERWFNIGDFVRVEPFIQVSGVVERITLRSTKLRSLNGEVVWLHNQYIQGVKVTPNGLRTIAVDVFTNNEQAGKKIIERAISTIPIGPMTAVDKVKIIRTEQWGDGLWLYTILGQTPPGREWIIEDYFVGSLTDLDAKRRGPKVFMRKPLVRYADPAAERSFKRAVRAKRR